MSERVVISEGEKYMVRRSAFRRRLKQARTLDFFDPQYKDTMMILSLLTKSLDSESFRELTGVFDPLILVSR